MPTNQLQAAWPLKKPQQLVYVELGASNGGMMLGICEQGFSYRAVLPFIHDGPVNFAFALDGKTRLQGIGEIVWSEDGGKTGGLKFTNVSPQFQETVRAWLNGNAGAKNIGREVTPATAIALDSIEKIKQEVRENGVVLTPAPAQKQPEQPKKQFKPRNWDTPVSEQPVPSPKPPETQVEPKAIEARAAETAPAQSVPMAEPPRPQAKPIEARTDDGKPAEQRTVEARSVEPEAARTELAEKSAVDFLLHSAEPAPSEQSGTGSGVALPKLRLPFAPVPAAPEPVAPAIPDEPVVRATQVEPALQVAPGIPEEPKPVFDKAPPSDQEHLPMDEVATALAASGLLGLHEPHDFVPAKPSPEEESSREFEPPRLNRAAAAAIIGLALAIIFVALVLSFRRDVGEALIHFGHMLAGEEGKPTAAQSSPAPVSAVSDDSSYPPAAFPLREANSQPDAWPKPAANNTVQPIGDPPASSGSSQKEFEQARNILKGNHRQRDLPLAVSLLWTGVEKGSVSAEVTLADLYARGDGVEKSCDQARVLLEAAIKKGSPEARRRLDLLKEQGCS
jgi:hypothetical protein